MLFFRRNNISSYGFFSFFIIAFCIAFTRKEKNNVKLIDDDICNRNMEFKSKSEIIIRNRNHKKKIDKKIWTVLICKEIAAPRNFLYKV